ncbi:MAG TPA: hypothetical protein DEA44_04165 [Firmicutes bacterium]|nr:hypothetical protein [Bacillota bacterium]
MGKFKKWYYRLIVSCVAVMLLSVSTGGAYLTPVYANPVQDQANADKQIKDKQKNTEQAVLGGLLLVGLIAKMGKHGSEKKSSESTNNGSGKTTEPANQQNTGSTAKSSMTAEEKQLVDLINSERTKQGLTTLKSNNNVANVARAHSQDMLANNYFDHYNLQGSSPFTRLKNAGITYRTAGENIAINVSVPNTHTAFMNSAGHRANILSSDYTQVGVGIVHSGSRIWVTENFIG